MAVTIELEASDLAAIAAAIRLDQAVELARIDQSISSRLASADYVEPDNTATLAAIEASTVLAKEATVLTRLASSNYTAPNNLSVSDIANATWNHADATALADEIAAIKDIEYGKWKIVNNQMIFYKADNTTEIARFDLKDANGVATMVNPTERIRV